MNIEDFKSWVETVPFAKVAVMLEILSSELVKRIAQDEEEAE